MLQDEVEGKGELVAAFVGAAILFGIGVWGVAGAEKAQEYFAGYLLEQSLSVDNLFVFILVFKYFKTPRLDQEKVMDIHPLVSCINVMNRFDTCLLLNVPSVQ